ncbi:MAG: glycosyltransferase [Alistipes sp.]|nr:glycosyltransferase [Alistipes sp.]
MNRMKSILMVGPAYPFRGGLAGFNQTLVRSFLQQGVKARMLTFTTQYPAFLFPGKSQYDDGPAPEGLDITRMLSSVNPWSWIRTGWHIRRLRPDAVIVRYWIPQMAPAFGTVCRIARWCGIPTLALLDNVIPHEHHSYDTWLTRYFLKSIDGFIYMSEQVHRDLLTFRVEAPVRFSPHPMFTHYGEAVSHEEACAHLNLDPTLRYALFFGFVRDYKGLDLLLDAWALLLKQGKLQGRKLLIAGEYYSGKERYEEQIRRLGIADRLQLFDYFIADNEVRYFFSAADLVVQPYRTATQSGITQVAYYFDVPMVVTDVGGLREIVPDGEVGFVTEPRAEAIAEAVARYDAEGWEPRFRERIRSYKQRFTWEAMTENFQKLYDDLLQRHAASKPSR